MNKQTGVRLAAALLCGFFLGSVIPAAPIEAPPRVERALVRLTPVPLDASDPARLRLGPLTYLGGWSLSSENRRFGGISALHVDGRSVTALSDTGTLLDFELPAGGNIAPLRIAELPAGPGAAGSKVDRDSEALAVSGASAWIAFENSNAVWRYALPAWRAEAAARPEQMRRWPVNMGAEALVRLRGGRFLVMAEAVRGDGTSAALLFAGDPTASRQQALSFRFRPPPGYRVTDAAALPDGRLVVLSRRLSFPALFSARLSLVRMPARIAPGSILEGEEIAHFRRPVAADNMEALSVTQEDGRTILWIASDDNFSPLQRSLLLKFALEE